MNREKIPARSPSVLSDEQREFFFRALLPAPLSPWSTPGGWPDYGQRLPRYSIAPASWQIVRGRLATRSYVELLSPRIPPNLSRLYTSIVELRDSPEQPGL